MRKGIIRKRILRIIAFVLLLGIALFGVSRWCLLSLRGTDSHEFNNEYFYEIKKDTTDVVFVGSSHCYCGFIPEELYEKYHISGYNISSSNQSMLANYLWVKEAYARQKFSYLIVEAQSVPLSHGDVTNDIRSLNSMGLSIHYFELMKTYKKEGIKVLFPIIDFHSDWVNIKADNYRKDVYPDDEFMRGYVLLTSCAGADNVKQIVDENDKESMDYLKYPYLDKIREFCNENGITLIMVKTVMADNDVNVWTTGMHNNLSQYCDTYGIAFFDFNCESLQLETGIDPATSVAADKRHCNYDGASKMTDFIGKYLSEEYGVYSDNDSFTQEEMDTFHNALNEALAGDGE